MRLLGRQILLLVFLAWQMQIAWSTVVPSNTTAIREMIDQVRHPSILAPYPPDLYFSFAATTIPADADAVFLQSVERANIWFYYNMSYHLYPRRVVWATPLPKSSEVDWHIHLDLNRESVERLLRVSRAHYLIVDGVSLADLDLPAGPRVTWYRREEGRYLVTVDDLETFVR